MEYIKSLWNFERTIEEIYQPRKNAFDLYRFVLASLVIVFHSYILSGSKGSDFLAIMTHGQTNLGEFAVGGFFVISGFLITQSLYNSASLFRYLWKRLLRLFPALFTSLFLSAILLGPFITNMSVNDYFFGGQGVGPFKFIFLNMTLNIFGFSYSIRDLFQNNPYPVAVNGSLWTLKHEFASYIIMAFLSYFFILKHPKLHLFFTGGTGLAYLANKFLNINLAGKITTTWWIFHSVEYPFFLKYFWMFLIGSILYTYRKSIFINLRILMLLICIFIGSFWIGYYDYIWFLFSPYLIVATAILLPFSGFSKYGDFSYGMYVYAFPVQQSIMFLLNPIFASSPRRLMLASFLITLVISVFSWKYVEAPALKLKGKLLQKKQVDKALVNL